MARRRHRPPPRASQTLEPQARACPAWDRRLWVAYHRHRLVTTLVGILYLTLRIRRCVNPACALFHQPYRPEAEGRLVLPQAEFGLDVIALVGTLRFGQQRSVPEIHRDLHDRGLTSAERTVTNLLARYEELVALRQRDAPQPRERLRRQGRVILAIDGLQPDVGHAVLWLVRDCLSGEVLRAKSLRSATGDDLAPLLREVKEGLPVPVAGIISDGQQSLRRAIAAAFPDVPPQRCQFHYLREAAHPIFEADRHAKEELKEHVRGIRPPERDLEGHTDPAALATRAYCQAVRSALSDDGRPPLAASGLQLVERPEAARASIARVREKRGPPSRSPVSNAS